MVGLSAQPGDEFVTELDVSELKPVLDEEEAEEDDDFDDLSGWSTEWSAGAGGPLAGQLSKALEGARSSGQSVRSAAGTETA